MSNCPPDIVASSLSKSPNPNVLLLKSNNTIKQLQTSLRAIDTSRREFKFCADRLIRLIVEEGLNYLSYEPKTVVTPTGCSYAGLRYVKGNCGISILRSGEAMEKGLRDCCRSIRIGKILMESDPNFEDDTRVIYAKLPDDVSRLKVLLLYPVIVSGCVVSHANRVFREYAIDDSNIVLLSLFATPHGIDRIMNTYPNIRLLTSEINDIAPSHFSKMYFGLD